MILPGAYFSFAWSHVAQLLSRCVASLCVQNSGLILVILSQVDLPSSTTYRHETSLPHHRVFERFVSGSGVSALAESMLGLTNGAVTALSEPERQPYGITQQLAIEVQASKPSVLRPIGVLPCSINLEIACQLPSSCTLRFKLEGGQQLDVQLHVQPTGLASSAITVAMRRNFSVWPGSKLSDRCVPSWCCALFMRIWQVAVDRQPAGAAGLCMLLYYVAGVGIITIAVHAWHAHTCPITP